MSGSALSYRPEIDGLRSVAILPVIVYHLKIPAGDGVLLPGGFFGVDVFFVLSGFLITRILLDEVTNTGRIDLWRFYGRRARRILPALLLVVLASMLAATFFMVPSELDRFAYSAIAAVGFFSNFFWYFELGEYGAQSGLLQPLLHIWSLAIEEQFYILFPFLIIILSKFKDRIKIYAFVVLFSISLGAAHFTSVNNPDLSFFSPLSRAWQMLAGSIAAWAATRLPRDGMPSFVRVLPSLAMIALLASMVLVDLPSVTHPGLVTVPVVLATVTMILFAGPGDPITRVLSLPPLVHVGRLSYSLYLWHFPIFAFGRLRSIGTPEAGDMALWCVLTFACAVLSYHLVEKPARYRVSVDVFRTGAATAAAVVLVFAALATRTDVLSRGRSADLAMIYGDNEPDNGALLEESWSLLDDLAGEEDIDTWNAQRPSENEKSNLWFKDPDDTGVLIVGDSHSKDLFNALALNGAAFSGFSFARFGLSAGFSAQQRALLFAAPNFEEAETIVIAPRYRYVVTENLAALIRGLRARGKHVVLVGNTAEFVSPGSLPLFDWVTRHYDRMPIQAELNRLGHLSLASGVRRLNAEMSNLADRYGIPFLSREALVCPEGQEVCTLMTDAGRKTMYDYGHWTLEGAALFGSRAAEQGWAEAFMPLR